MDTKSLIIEVATKIFQEKGYMGVGLNEILKECNISKGSLYHHFPNGKEELLIACLHTLTEKITMDMKQIFKKHPTTEEAIKAMVNQLIIHFETEGTITSYTFTSIVSEMGSLSESVRNACSLLYTNIQKIYCDKLVEDGLSLETANSIALTMTASIEGGIMLCLTKKSSEPLREIANVLTKTSFNL
ncbi:TetR/AcrR family transcriptional regulator [Oceanobacillus piezotolerans]|uniref:TetR/AcrR family transcriptional regulator n=1 Tax=Oceanobacillus piezotolerans TaxID=2448030 RepID=A0A498D3D8_9BACI|nr:TetR/AcrR family transcriptional regulator [Oceanobacillus piezotolerans]RLL42692.1 TetR/AcrR family transcriptional regulator [Oceanobacillus piezotolerans]